VVEAELAVDRRGARVVALPRPDVPGGAHIAPRMRVDDVSGERDWPARADIGEVEAVDVEADGVLVGLVGLEIQLHVAAFDSADPERQPRLRGLRFRRVGLEDAGGRVRRNVQRDALHFHARDTDLSAAQIVQRDLEAEAVHAQHRRDGLVVLRSLYLFEVRLRWPGEVANAQADTVDLNTLHQRDLQAVELDRRMALRGERIDHSRAEERLGMAGDILGDDAGSHSHHQHHDARNAQPAAASRGCDAMVDRAGRTRLSHVPELQFCFDATRGQNVTAIRRRRRRFPAGMTSRRAPNADSLRE
jgi:hypothetical protein